MKRNYLPEWSHIIAEGIGGWHYIINKYFGLKLSIDIHLI